MTVQNVSARKFPASASPHERRAGLISGDPLATLDRMVEIRVVEEQIQQLFLQGLIAGTTHTCQGQEAVSVAAASVLRPTDPVFCTYRGHGWALALGAPALAVIGEVVGRTVGSIGGRGGSMHLSARAVGLWPTNAIVGAQLPIAAGAAMASQVRGEDTVALGVFGDGAANIGAFHETLNLAAVQRLPVVFLCENNLYGEYSPMASTTSVPNIADRAGAYGIPGEAVDGQAIAPLREALSRAVERARRGEGPTLIEARTYRFVGHSRSDPAKYRPAGELDAWLARDPLILQAAAVDPKNPAGLLAELRRRWEAAIAETIQQVLASPPPSEASMFDRIYASTDS